jgi:hypothetical protein
VTLLLPSARPKSGVQYFGIRGSILGTKSAAGWGCGTFGNDNGQIQLTDPVQNRYCFRKWVVNLTAARKANKVKVLVSVLNSRGPDPANFTRANLRQNDLNVTQKWTQERKLCSSGHENYDANIEVRDVLLITQLLIRGYECIKGRSGKRKKLAVFFSGPGPFPGPF